MGKIANLHKQFANEQSNNQLTESFASGNTKRQTQNSKPSIFAA